jgi:hypothetical protein
VNDGITRSHPGVGRAQSEIFLTGISKNAGGPIKADLNSQLLNKDVNPEGSRPPRSYETTP